MDKLLKRTLENHTVKFNKDIGNGLARPYVEILPEYLSTVFKSAVSTLSDDVGFIYKGYRKLTPLEDFYNNINASATKNIVDISRNYLYKVEYGFEYNGEEIKRVIALPYVNKGSYLKLSDAHYSLAPVLSEYPVSPAPGELFIRILRDKLNIKKMYRNILIDGEKVSVQVIHSRSYKLISNVNEVIPIALYGFLKYGFYGLFKKLFNTVPIIVNNEMDLSKYREDYIEYTTTGLKPRGLKVINYNKHSVSILIKREDRTPVLDIYVASLIYSLDMAPLYANNIISVADVNKPVTTYFTLNDIDDESLFWITLLGKIIFKNKYTLDRVQIDMIEHINILNGYLDSVVKKRLLDINIDVEDFFELLIWSINNFNDLVMKYDTYASNHKNRYLDLPYYILYDLIVGINKSFLEIKRNSVKNRLGVSEINRIFNKYISTRKIFNLIKSSSTNIAVTPLDSSSDNWFFKATSILQDQNRANGVNISKKNAFPLFTRSIHGEDIVFGSLLMLTKKAPTPRFRFNAYVDIDISKGNFIISEKESTTIEKIDKMLLNTFEDNSMLESNLINDIDIDNDME